MREHSPKRLPFLANILLVVGMGIIRMILRAIGDIPYYGILSLVYIGVYCQWLLSVRRRFLHRSMRRILTAAAVLMIFWITIRYVKYEIIPTQSDLSRYIWYAYYIPLTLLPVLMFNATLYVGRTDRSGISRAWRLLYIPACLVILGILTNDLHQLAFHFQTGFASWETAYAYGPLYYAAAAIFAASVAGIMVIVFVHCAKHRFRALFWLPAATIAVGALYYLLYPFSSTQESILLRPIFELPEFTCLILICFWESLAITHLIPSNTQHEAFFRASSIQAGLADNAFRVALKAAKGTPPTPAQLKASEGGAILLKNGDALLRSHSVKGGYFYWIEDVRELNRLNRELEDTADYLQEEHAMLDLSAQIEESRRHTEAQNSLYNQITRDIRPQLEELEALLESPPEDEDSFCKTMERAGVLGAYVKRRSNLLLLADTDREISSGELGISIEESLEYVRLLGIPCQARTDSGIALPSAFALYLYKLFEVMLEAALPDAGAILVTLNASGDNLRFYMEAALPNDDAQKHHRGLDNGGSEAAAPAGARTALRFDEAQFRAEALRWNAELRLERGDGAEILSLCARLEGEAA